MARSWRAFARSTWDWLVRDQRAVRVFIVLVLSVDVVLIAIHVVVMVGWDAPNEWRVDMDGSFGEAFQYAKYLWLMLLIVWYARERRDRAILAWIPLFAYFLIDDALLLHERAGLWFEAQESSFGLGPLSAQTAGELAFTAVSGLVLLAVLLAGYARAGEHTKWLFRLFGALVVVLVFFAIVVDVFHAPFQDIRVLDRGIGLIEDAGEMLAVSALVVVAFRITVTTTPDDSPDRPVARTRSVS